MKTQTDKILTGLAAIMAAGITAHAQYTYTTLEDPLGVQTTADAIDGANIVGYYLDSSNNDHGFLYDGSAWATLDDPLAASGITGGTYPFGISGTNIVGWYVDASGKDHGFLYDGNGWTNLDDPLAGSGSGQGTLAYGISDTNIVGGYFASDGGIHGFLYNLVTRNWTTLDDPSAGSGSGQGTGATGISGANIVGQYIDANGNTHGFLYNGSNYVTVDDPLGVLGTDVIGISGANISGSYEDGSGNFHGFLYNGKTYTRLDDPMAPPGRYPTGGTYVHGVSGSNVVGVYYNSTPTHGFLATPIPRLTIWQSSNNLNLSWPYSPFISWTLQQNSDLTTTNWTAAPTAGISNDGTNNFITITPSPGNLFFRLSQQ